MRQPLAYLLTWSCYGTWLHGDERGSVDRDHNEFATPYLAPNAPLVATRSRALKHPPVTLSSRGRQVVEVAIREHASVKSWTIRALNVRTNHVHVVISGDATPERMLDQLKAWATRTLRTSGAIERDGPVWTVHGSTRYLWNERDVAEAVDYVLNRQ